MQRSSPAYVPSVGNPKFAPPPGDYLPDLVQPKVLQLSGMCLPLRPPNEADITFFPPGTVPVNVRMILGCTVPRALIRDPDVVLSRCVPGQTFHLRMMYPKYFHVEFSICARMNGDILTKGTMLVVAATAVYRFYRMIEDINSKEGKDSPNYRSVPDASDFKIMELQPISVKDSIWNIAISLRR